MKHMLMGTILAAGIAMQAPAAQDHSVDALLGLAASGKQSELADAIDDLVEDKGLPARQREAMLYRFALGVRRLPPGDIPVGVLGELARYESTVMKSHPESRGAVTAPMYPVARVAQGSIRFARYETQVTGLRRALAESPVDFFHSLGRGKSSFDAQLISEAVQRSEPDALRGMRDPLIEAWRQRPALAPAAASLAIRLGDVELAARLIDEADAPSARRVLTSAAQSFDAASVMALIRAGARRPDLDSVAVLAAGDLIDVVPETRQWLYRILDDPRLGSSAATALARNGGAEAVAYAIESLHAGMPLAGMKHRLLLLHLAGTPESRAFLQAFIEDPAMPASLRREVRQWQ